MFEKVKLSRNKVEQWNSPLFEILTDNEILKAVENDVNVPNMSDKPDEDRSHSKIYFCFKVSSVWMEQQKKFSATQLMLMRYHRHIIAQKKLFLFKIVFRSEIDC
ncbi:hypothetical protein T4A_7980 [Trichinella pseudospiralis]|uniref:Uncharacterized protein n=1 Tax=Trichinella pseudospiralis TaxID=6337 RepID=A0A0V1DVG1_TRIPS|nr:hypothetical protein T4E_6473 [Trichinella pseudospiralis]KRY65498.1 hypothetical protein T4A_7980 [Trichinella pseudospiralis]KRY87274.1 hypothetical protein T4D_8743 [Trichinella pseudospiralis]KRZ26218.1 hypothetical protein T4C_8116 [Trichinella pseudospiralis]